MNSLRVAAGDVQIAGFLGTAAEHDGVIAVQNLSGIHSPAHIHVGAELNALSLHNFDAALDDGFVQLHVGDAVHQQTAHTVSTLEDGDGMAPDVEVFGH